MSLLVPLRSGRKKAIRTPKAGRSWKKTQDSLGEAKDALQAQAAVFGCLRMSRCLEVFGCSAFGCLGVFGAVWALKGHDVLAIWFEKLGGFWVFLGQAILAIWLFVFPKFLTDFVFCWQKNSRTADYIRNFVNMQGQVLSMKSLSSFPLTTLAKLIEEAEVVVLTEEVEKQLAATTDFSNPGRLIVDAAVPAGPFWLQVLTCTDVTS